MRFISCADTGHWGNGFISCADTGRWGSEIHFLCRHQQMGQWVHFLCRHQVVAEAGCGLLGTQLTVCWDPGPRCQGSDCSGMFWSTGCLCSAALRPAWALSRLPDEASSPDCPSPRHRPRPGTHTPPPGLLGRGLSPPAGRPWRAQSLFLKHCWPLGSQNTVWSPLSLAATSSSCLLRPRSHFRPRAASWTPWTRSSSTWQDVSAHPPCACLQLPAGQGSVTACCLPSESGRLCRGPAPRVPVSRREGQVTEPWAPPASVPLGPGVAGQPQPYVISPH